METGVGDVGEKKMISAQTISLKDRITRVNGYGHERTKKKKMIDASSFPSVALSAACRMQEMLASMSFVQAAIGALQI